MTTSNIGIELIQRHEGLRLQAYKCPADVWTIGYGHTRTAKQGLVITPLQAQELLKEDLLTAENAVNNLHLNVNQVQYDALVSFVFNLGSGNFQRSTLLKKIKANANDPAISSEFAKWIRGGGRVLPGLVKRRREEAELYFSNM